LKLLYALEVTVYSTKICILWKLLYVLQTTAASTSCKLNKQTVAGSRNNFMFY